MQDLSGHPLGKKLSRPFEDLELHLQEVEDSEFRWKKCSRLLLIPINIFRAFTSQLQSALQSVRWTPRQKVWAQDLIESLGCIPVFLGKTNYFHNVSLQPEV